MVLLLCSQTDCDVPKRQSKVFQFVSHGPGDRAAAHPQWKCKVRSKKTVFLEASTQLSDSEIYSVETPFPIR